MKRPTGQAHVEIFFGEATSALARIYVRSLNPDAGDFDAGDLNAGELHIAGTVTGPECRFARTLSTTFTLRDHGGGLAEAVVLEPCFWTPGEPYLYRVNIELFRGQNSIACVDHAFGIRPLAAAGRDLVLERRRWVLRAVRHDEVPGAPLAEWRETGTAMYVVDPDEALCEQASRDGVLIVAELGASAADAIPELRRLARWPAVGMLVMRKSASPTDASLRCAERNLVLVELCDISARGEMGHAAAASCMPAPWAHALLHHIDPDGELRVPQLAAPLPQLVMRPVGPQASVEAARATCDRLQAELAARGDFAGYIV